MNLIHQKSDKLQAQSGILLECNINPAIYVLRNLIALLLQHAMVTVSTNPHIREISCSDRHLRLLQELDSALIVVNVNTSFCCDIQHRCFGSIAENQLVLCKQALRKGRPCTDGYHSGPELANCHR